MDGSYLAVRPETVVFYDPAADLGRLGQNEPAAQLASWR
jgi:hypothetical protein